MENPTFDGLRDLLVIIKKQTHDLNRTFFSSTKNKNKAMKYSIEYAWGTIQKFRTDFELPDTEPYQSIQKIAGQLSRMRNVVMKDQFDKSIVEKEFLVLRRFVDQLEKNLVRQLYFAETGVQAEKIGGLGWAAKIAGKSEVTVRRYIFAEKIKAYKLIKIWWIPYEEIQKVGKKKRLRGEEMQRILFSV